MTTRSVLHAAGDAALTIAYGVFAVAISPVVLIAMIVAAREEERDLRLLAEDAGMTVDEYVRAEHARIEGYYHGNV